MFVKISSLTFRNKIFIANIGLISLLLFLVASIVQHQILTDVTAQARQAMVASRPLYQLVWQQRTQVMANACYNITQTNEIKRVLATRDSATIKDIVSEMLKPQVGSLDLLIVSDKQGNIISTGPSNIGMVMLVKDRLEVQ